MADDTRGTLTPAKVWFATHDDHFLDVTEFTVTERMSSLFEVTVIASSTDGAVDLDSIVGAGAALRFPHHNGDLVWAGYCTEASQIGNQPEGSTVSLYRFVIEPALARTKLRQNCRVFQRKTVPEIVAAILGEWKLPHRLDLRETHPTQEYRVQYNETDYEFLCRLLEEAGISFFFDHTPKKTGAGSNVSSIVFRDQPQQGEPLGGAFPYRAHARHNTWEDGENAIWDVRLTQRIAPGRVTIRDFDFRKAPHTNIIGESKIDKPAGELAYEHYHYVPSAFWGLNGPADVPSPVADDKGMARTLDDHASVRAARELQAARHGRSRVTFSTTALELAPGDILAIGQGSSQTHPNPRVGADKKLLVIGRTLQGAQQGIEEQTVETVPADEPHRPAKSVPPRFIQGLQSAVVVGPQSQEIHTDEFGRVRVQFPWDREHGFDDESSCWMRVSQTWAGTGFGSMTLPRVGHHVLVGFLEGNPDRPVVVGRLHDGTNSVVYALPAHKTLSGIQTESTGGDSRSRENRGDNTITFNDAVGVELIAVQAEKDCSVLVNENETRDILGSRVTRIGMIDATHVGDVAALQAGKKTGVVLKKETELVLSTSGASIVLRGNEAQLQASGAMIFLAGGELHVSGGGGNIQLFGREDPACGVRLNCSVGEDVSPRPVPLYPAVKPHPGAKLPAPYYPEGASAPMPAQANFEEVKVEAETGQESSGDRVS